MRASNRRRMSGARRALGLALALLGPVLVAALMPAEPTPIDAELVLLVIVTVSAAVGGFLAGGVATLVATGVVAYYFSAPEYSWQLLRRDDVIGVGAFLLTAATVTVAWDRLESARARTRRALLDRQDALATLDSIIWTTPFGMAILDTELRYVRVNRALAELNGIPAEAMLGRTILDVVPTLPEEVIADLHHVLTTGEVVSDREVEIPMPDEERYFLSSYFPVRDAGGSVAGVGATVVDITGRKRTEHEREQLIRELGTQRARLEAVLQSLPAGLVLADADTGRVEMANAVAEELLGEEVRVKTSVAEWDAARARRPDGVRYDPRMLPLVRAFRDGETVVGEEMVYELDDGREATYSVNAAPVRAPEGTIESAVLAVLDISRHVEAEQRAVEEGRIAETLHRVGRRLAEKHDLREILQVVTDASTEVTNAGFGAFFYNTVDERGESLSLYTLSGVPAGSFAAFPMPRNTAVFGPTFRGEGVVRSDDITADPRYGRNPPYHGMPQGHLPVRSYLAVPVVSRSGEVHGGLFFGHPEPGRFDARDERVVVGIAAQAAVAIDNARLYEAERTAREQAEVARRRLAILADASRALATTLDEEQTMRGLARVCVPRVADHCLIDVRRDDGSMRRLVSVSDKAGSELEEALRTNPPDLSIASRHPAAAAVQAGRPVLMSSFGPAVIDAIARNDRHRRAVEKLAPTSAAIIPLVARENVLGAITFVTSEPSVRRLGHEDLPLLEEIARRAAIALENARLYARQRDVAETLQRSLLPARLPMIPGVTTAVRYAPGGPGVEVGGDWYEVLALPGGAVALAMGDVVGRGIPAATLMGQLRNALRAYALEGHRPADIARLLNRLLQDEEDERFATLVLGILELETGTLRLVNAGHPPPIVRHADGSTAMIEEGRGLPLGALARAEYEEAILALPPGSTLALYTDGLVEERTAPLTEGLYRLRSVLASGSEDIEVLAQHVIEGTLEGRSTADDVALLLVRPDPLGDLLRLQLPADAAMLAPLRATLRRWLAAAGASEEESYEIVVACGEACTNAIEHALGAGDGSFEVEADRGEDVVIRVRDHGTWRTPRKNLRGRGIGIMRSLMDDVQIHHHADGTEVVLTRRLRVPSERSA